MSYQCISELPLELISMTTPPTKNRCRRTLIQDNLMAGGLTTHPTIWGGHAGSGVMGDLPYSLEGIFLSSIVLIVFAQNIKLPVLRFINVNTQKNSQKLSKTNKGIQINVYLCLKSERVQFLLRGTQQKSNLKAMRVKFDAEIDNHTCNFLVRCIRRSAQTFSTKSAAPVMICDPFAMADSLPLENSTICPRSYAIISLS